MVGTCSRPPSRASALLLGYPPARPTQRGHSYQLQTAIGSVGALRHASLVCSSRLLMSSVPLKRASLLIGTPCPTRAAATSHREGPPALAGLSLQRKAGISCPHLFSPSRLCIPSAHLVCSSRVIIHNKIVLVIVGPMLVIIVITVVCILLINNTNVVIVVRVMNLITTNIILIIFAEVT